ncbi:MAG: hypothetical protein AB1730_07245 [Myxococcota bacterium]
MTLWASTRRVFIPLAAALALALFGCGGSTSRGDGGSGGGTATGGGGGGGAMGGGGGTADGGTGGGSGNPDGGCSEANLPACNYPVGAGTFTQRQSTITDPVTGRVLPLLARVPAGSGPFPVVVYSHGGGLLDQGHLQSTEWAESLAQHGFLTVNVGHVGLDTDAGVTLCGLAQVPMSECVAPTDDDTDGLLALVKARDLTAVLDALPALKQTLEMAGGPQVDLAHVAVMGWSAGSRAPLIMHGATFHPSASAPLYSSPHNLPVAAVALSPTGPGYGGFFAETGNSSWDQVRGPVFTATGDNDVKPTKPGLTGPVRRVSWERQPADGTRWLLYSKLPPGVGGHSTYNLEDLTSTDPRLQRISYALRSAVLAFLDAQLKGDPAAAAYLASGDVLTLAGDADWQHQ